MYRAGCREFEEEDFLPPADEIRQSTVHVEYESLPDRFFRNPFSLSMQPNGEQVRVESLLPPRQGAPVNFQASCEGKIFRSEERRVGKESRSRWAPYQ